MAKRNRWYSQYSEELKKSITINIKKDFTTKHLSKNLMENGIKELPYKLIIAPRKYDTAHYIRTGRSKSYGGIGVHEMRWLSGSYANELNKIGSEFEVFKKPDNLPDNIKKRTIANISESRLERVMVKPHNHKNYLSDAIRGAVDKFKVKHYREIEGIKIWLVN